MIITPDMPKEPGSTVEASGALIEWMDVEGWDGVGAKVISDAGAIGGPVVKLTVDSSAWPNKTIYMDPDDAAYLGRLLIDAAAKVAAARRALG